MPEEMAQVSMKSQIQLATDETRIEHGLVSVFDPCLIRGCDFGFGLYPGKIQAKATMVPISAAAPLTLYVGGYSKYGTGSPGKQ
jgi:hypothetical protein